MIDMREIYTNKDFQDSVDKFLKDNSCKWSIFKKSFLKFSNHKCPICEDSLNRYDDIDHFRPKNMGYKFLECCYKNYMIMCSDCNRNHKGREFKLDSDFIATSKNDISKEKPLLINPTTDNIFDFFQLIFLQQGEKLLLEIYPKDELDKNTYQYRQALNTIETYGIGFCLDNPKVDGCRINILEEHYEKFYPLAKARQKGKKEFLKLLKTMPKRAEYGFVKFIAKEQFKIIEAEAKK